MNVRCVQYEDFNARSKCAALTLSDFRTYIYVQNPKTVATPVRKYTYPDGNQNMGASNGHFTVSGPLHHDLCT